MKTNTLLDRAGPMPKRAADFCWTNAEQFFTGELPCHRRFGSGQPNPLQLSPKEI